MILSTCNTLCVISLSQHPCGPHLTPVAAKTLFVSSDYTNGHLFGPKPTRVTTTASCLSPDYLCSYHNTQFVLSRPCLSKAHYCGPLPTPVAIKKSGGPQPTTVASQHSVHPQSNHVSTKKPQLWSSAIRYFHHSKSGGLSLLSRNHNTLCALSLPQYPPQPHCRHQSTPADTTALHLASIPQRPQRASLVVLSIPLKQTQHPGGI